MSSDSKPRTSLGIGFHANRGRTPGAEAWKQHIGNKPVPARLAVLPDAESRWGRLGLSAVVQVAFLMFLLLVPLMYPEQMKTGLRFINIEIAQPMTEIPVAPDPPPPPKVKAVVPKPEIKPDPVEPVKLNPTQPHIFADLAKPKPVVPKVEKIDVKAPDVKPTFEAAKLEIKENGPKRPKEDVKVGNLSSGSAVIATMVAPVDKVQTGGFGDPNGLPGKGNPNHAANVNRLGSPALPVGGGYGNGTGGSVGIRGTVASTGFGNGTAIPPANSAKKGTVVAGGFSDAATAGGGPKKRIASNGPADTTPDILEKPRPEYTEEGRRLRVEGDVVIELVFLANGSIQINRVVSGLGHGLDEAAVRAAQQIKFRPAKRESEPVDFPARVRIEFRLAY